MARAAVWDLGSSSFQVLVCDQRGCEGLVPVLRRRALLNLGTWVGAGGSIPKDRVAASLSAVKRLRLALDTVRPDVVVALATAALRDASNGAEVVARVEELVGQPVNVLEGEEEARLCFVGQRAGVWTGPGTACGIDLGGGSFEVAVGGASGIDYATSAPVGATRLRGEIGAPDRLGTAERDVVRRRTALALTEVRTALAAFPGVTRRALVSGGTARALARLATAHTRERESAASADVNQVELPALQVHEWADRLAPLGLKDRLALPGMPARRAPMLPIGVAILSALAAELEVERFVVSVWGLREGALLDVLARRRTR
jgi:exopolyphosphatase / guanosine-5'-triphosphate,3'-diphosphate pyrophosphatase